MGELSLRCVGVVSARLGSYGECDSGAVCGVGSDGRRVEESVVGDIVGIG